MTDAAQKTRAPAAPITSPTATRPPPIKSVLGNTAPTRSEQETELVQLPDPVGYHMLVALPTMAEQTASGLYIPETVNERERAASVVGVVLAMGPLCYKDIKKFGVPTTVKVNREPFGETEETRLIAQPWCQVGDTVLFSRYQGMRFRSKDSATGDMVEYRMLTDDGIVGTVPEGAEVGGL